MIHSAWFKRAVSLPAATALAILSLALGSAAASADPLFAAAFLSFDAGIAPASVAIGDLNRDGKSDLAVANGGGTVSVLLGNGDGTFGAKVDYEAGVWPTSVAIGDLNGDGQLDLAVTNRGAATVSVLLGNGDGTFGAKTDYGTGTYPHSVAIGDLDGDEKPDLVVANYGSNTVSVLLGKGDGSFGVKADYGAGSGPRSVAIGDLNGDGKPDLAVANAGLLQYGNTVSVLLGYGDGTFGTKTDYAVGRYPYSVAIGDLNGDGKPDLAVANSELGAVSVLLGNGDGTFGTKTDYGTGGQSVAMGDLNGDGKLDLAVANQLYNAVRVLLGNGDGTFGAGKRYGTGFDPCAVAIGDLNGDGKPDLAVANAGFAQACGNAVSILLGNGDGTFGAAKDYLTGYSPYAVAIGDLNGDGKPDLAVADSYDFILGGDFDLPGGMVSVLLGNGDGTFGAKTDYKTGSSPHSVAIGDLNGDGKLDLAVANAYSFAVSVLLGNGDGTFGTKTDYGTWSGPSSVAIGDLNGDGKPDLAVANAGLPQAYGNTVSVFLGNGNGTFGAETDYGTALNPQSVAIGDLNGDTKPDLVTANSGVTPNFLGTVSVLLGNGTGMFETRTDYGTGDYPRSVAIADLNGDGVPDLSTVNRGVSPTYLGTVSVLLGNGDGTFASKADYRTGGGGPSGNGAIADLNGDGRLDLATANSSNTVSVLLGNGDGTFGVKTDYGTGNGPSSVAAGDLNGDGKLDLVTADHNAYSNTVSVLLGIGPGCILVGVQIEPDILNLRSMARWVTCILEPPTPYEPTDIDVGSIQLASVSGSISPDPEAPVEIGDADGDGIADLMVKFQRSGVIGLLQGGPTELTASGTLGGRCFQGKHTVRLVPVGAPAAGSSVAPGAIAQVSWEPPAEPGFESVDLLLSLDEGETWSLEAQALPNTGHHSWSVPNVTTDRARLAVSMVRTVEGGTTEARIGISGRFSILTTTAVDAGIVSFALHGITPNPAVDALHVSFSLPDARPAVLALYDVAGRQIASREVGGLGAGRHTITLAPAGMAAGVYVVRLSRGGTKLTARAVLVR